MATRHSPAAAGAESGARAPLAVQRVPISSLVPDPANVRQHSPGNLDAIVGSLRRFGQQKPIVVDQDGIVRAGNGTLLAARQLGWTEIDVVRTGLRGLEATAYSIADNRTTDLSAFDEPALAQLLQQLQADEAGLDGVGFTGAEIDELLAELAGPKALDDHGPMAPPVNPVSRPGDLWHLGEHQLLCGDATKWADVERLMAGEHAALVATDPPYLVDYTGERPNASGKDWSATYREIDIEDAAGFFRDVFTHVLAVLAPHAAIYCWHAHKRCGEIQRVWAELGIVDHQQIIWVKPAAVFGRVYWHFRHEPCAMGWKKGSQPAHDSDHQFDSVWEVDWEGKARFTGDHPTTKPVELFARPMRKHTKAGDVVFEPFSGSGSQLIAAESLRRRCRALELAPAYVDVALRRWETATGKQALLDGKGYAAVAAERGVPLKAEAAT
ncbi:MAG TPA: site-specific DNA-methyltransferase [Planctomycetota bacterium]|nr:site-specific DNA-methyltransferase [Planctomycetota bacterium]